MARTSIQNANASVYLPVASKVSVPFLSTGLKQSVTFGGWIKKDVTTRQTFPVPFTLWGRHHVFSSFNNFANVSGGAFSMNGLTNDTINTTISSGGNGVYMLNQWAHLVVSYNGASISVSINGEPLSGSKSTSGDFTIVDNTLTIGTYQGSGNDFGGSFQGVFASSLMTQDEIRQAYSKNTFNQSKLKGFWPLDEGAGTIAYDTSGNGNNGTITLPTWTRDAPSKTRKTVNDNLVYNGDFEIAPVVNVAQATGSSNWLDGTSAGSTTNNTFGWRKFNYTGSQHAYFDSTEKYSGQYSLRLSTLGTGATVGVTNSTQATLDPFTSIPCTPSTAYTLKFWMKTNVVSGSATSGAFLRLTAGNVSDSTKIKTNTDWTQYTVTVTTGAATSIMSIELRIIGNDGTGTLIMDAWFDDITLTPTTATTRTALTKSRVKIQEDNYSVQWPTLGSGSGEATASANLQTLGVSNLNYSGGIWFRELSRRLTFGNIILRLTGATPFRYAFQITTSNNDRHQVNFYDGTLNPGLSSPKSYPIGTWYHVAFTREGTTVKLYVNGVLSTTGTITVGTTVSNSVGLGVNNAFAGNVSDAFIYGSVLTADEIYAIYANDVYPSGALLKAKLNDGTGTTAADQSGNGVDFTLTTPTWSTDTATGKRTVVS